MVRLPRSNLLRVRTLIYLFLDSLYGMVYESISIEGAMDAHLQTASVSAPPLCGHMHLHNRHESCPKKIPNEVVRHPLPNLDELRHPYLKLTMVTNLLSSTISIPTHRMARLAASHYTLAKGDSGDPQNQTAPSHLSPPPLLPSSSSSLLYSLRIMTAQDARRQQKATDKASTKPQSAVSILEALAGLRLLIDCP